VFAQVLLALGFVPFVLHDAGMVTCMGGGCGVRDCRQQPLQKFAMSGWPLLVLLTVSACRSHSAVAPAQSKDSQAAVVQPARMESAPEKSCREFVQGFYDWYFDRLNTEKTRQIASPSDYEVLALRPHLFTLELRKMLHDDAVAASKNPGEIVGLDFDPFINAQDWEGKYWVKSVNVKDDTCHASVWGSDAGKKVDIVGPELRMIGSNWVFVDFFYPESMGRADASLMGILTDLRNEREPASNEKRHK